MIATTINFFVKIKIARTNIHRKYYFPLLRFIPHTGFQRQGHVDLRFRPIFETWCVGWPYSEAALSGLLAVLAERGYYFFSFTLCPAHSKVGRGNLGKKQLRLMGNDVSQRFTYLRFVLSAEFARHCVLSIGTQRHSAYDQSEVINILDITFPLMEIKLTTVALTISPFCLCHILTKNTIALHHSYY